MVVADMFKQHFHRGLRPNLFFYRDSSANEVDLVMERGRKLALIEVKSGQTVNRQFFKGLERFSKVAEDRIQGGVVVYGGEKHQARSDWEVWPVKNLNACFEKVTGFLTD